MSTEDNIKTELLQNFAFLENRIAAQRARRISADTEIQNFSAVFDYAVKRMGFTILCTITGMDEGAMMALIYHIARPDGVILNLKTRVPKENPVVKTVINYFPPADIYEREIMDLLGIVFEGLPDGKRYPLPDDWPKGSYPLRKDWKTDDVK